MFTSDVSEVGWAPVSSRTQFQPQIIPDPGYLPDYLFIYYGYVNIKQMKYLDLVIIVL